MTLGQHDVVLGDVVLGDENKKSSGNAAFFVGVL